MMYKLDGLHKIKELQAMPEVVHETSMGLERQMLLDKTANVAANCELAWRQMIRWAKVLLFLTSHKPS